LFPGAVLDSTWDDRCADLTRAADRLRSINAQDTLILLRVSFSAPRVQHLLRCSPSVDHPALKTFDNILRSAVNDITHAEISDVQWLQARLPIKQGGLGVREVHSLARPAYLASAASTLDLQTSVLTACPCATDSHLSRTSVFGRRTVASCQPRILFHPNSLSGTNRTSCLFVIWSNLFIQIPNRELDSWLSISSQR